MTELVESSQTQIEDERSDFITIYESTQNPMLVFLLFVCPTVILFGIIAKLEGLYWGIIFSVAYFLLAGTSLSVTTPIKFLIYSNKIELMYMCRSKVVYYEDIVDVFCSDSMFNVVSKFFKRL